MSSSQPVSENDRLKQVKHVTFTSPSSAVTSALHISPVKCGASSAPNLDREKLHSMSSTELRRDSFPPYSCSTTKRSTAVVTPSLARTRPAQPTTTPSAPAGASSLLRFPSLSSSTLHRLSTPPLTRPVLPLLPPRTTSNEEYSRRYLESVKTRSLLAPSIGASGGISYSLAQPSALATGNHSAANLSAGRSSSQTTPLHQLHPVSSSSTNPDRRDALLRGLTGMQQSTRERDLSNLYSLYRQQEYESDLAMARYRLLHGLQAVAPQHSVAASESSSASSISSQRPHLQITSSSGGLLQMQSIETMFGVGVHWIWPDIWWILWIRSGSMYCTEMFPTRYET